MASTILSYSLALALLCFSFHASCNARSLIGVLHENAAKNSQQHSSSKGSTQKDDQLMMDPARVSTRPDAKSSTPNSTSDARGANKLEKERIINGESEEPTKNHHQTSEAGDPVKESVTTKNESPSRVSWKVPHNQKRGEQEPGFNLDYLPPKTHPPVHN